MPQGTGMSAVIEDAARRSLLACVLVLSGPLASAADVPAPPEDPSYAGAPAEVREFLVAAHAADLIKDPLERCLAFPDLPGNQWPEGMARAHCQANHGPKITLAQVQALLDRDAIPEIDALFAADLERHFSDTGFSEAIHSDFDAFQASYETGRLTKAWLDKAPGSAYAQAARASYYRHMAWQARGNDWMRDTPDENVVRMREFAALAMEHYRRATEIEPRLLSAYAELVNIGNLVSDSAVERWALQAANRIDPACHAVAQARMASLEPRWGGSYALMQAFADELAPFAVRRPLLALSIAAPAVDVADVLRDDDRYTEAIEVLRPVALRTTSPGAQEDLADSMLQVGGDPWMTLVHLLEAARFRQGRPYIVRTLGRSLLWHAEDPAWALRYLEQANRLDPDDAYVHYLMASAYRWLGRVADAERHYRVAVEDDEVENLRRDSLHELIATLGESEQFEEALVEVEILNREFPEFAIGWRDRFLVLGPMGMDGGLEAAEKYVELADRRDPAVREEVEQLEREIAKFREVLDGR